MHANEREPQGTDISLQTYMHIERLGWKMKALKTDNERHESKKEGKDGEREKEWLKEDYRRERKRQGV